MVRQLGASATLGSFSFVSHCFLCLALMATFTQAPTYTAQSSTSFSPLAATQQWSQQEQQFSAQYQNQSHAGADTSAPQQSQHEPHIIQQGNGAQHFLLTPEATPRTAASQHSNHEPNQEPDPLPDAWQEARSSGIGGLLRQAARVFSTRVQETQPENPPQNAWGN